MTQTTHLPGVRETIDFFSNLMGLDITGREIPALESQVIVLADYSDENDETNHFIACDLQLAAILGACLKGFPPERVKADVSTNTLSEDLAANVAEILNISVNLFPQSRFFSIALDRISGGDEAAQQYEAWTAIPRTYLELEVPRYGSGTMAIGAT